MIYIFVAFYVVLSGYSAVMAVLGISSLLTLTRGDSTSQNRRFAWAIILTPIAISIFASLIFDELMRLGFDKDVVIGSRINYLYIIGFMMFEMINSIFLNVFTAFGVQPNFDLKIIPSISRSSLLLFSLNSFGSLVGFNLVAVAARFLWVPMGSKLHIG